MGILDKGKTRGKGSRKSRGSDQDLSDAVLQLREAGLVPWWWIVDETRHLTTYRYAPTVAEYLADMVESATIDRWGGVLPPLILTESRTFGGVLDRTVAAEYIVPVAATNGQVGGFLRTDIGPLMVGEDGELRRVLYIGDLDLQGGQIEANTRKVLEEEACGELDWTRVALTSEQAKRYNLKKIKKVDERYKKDLVKRDGWAIEVESLGQSRVTDIVRGVLDELLPEPLVVVEQREEAERAEVRARLQAW